MIGGREGAKLRAGGDHAPQGLAVHGVVLRQHPVVGGLAGLRQDGLVGFRQLVPLLLVDDEVQHRAALPPARGIVVFRDLQEAELLVVVGADELGRVDGAALQRRIDVAAARSAAAPRRAWPAPCPPSPPMRNFRPLRSSRPVDLLAEEAAHLGAGVAAGEPMCVEAGEDIVDDLLAAAEVPPGMLLAGVEAERQAGADGRGPVPCRCRNRSAYGRIRPRRSARRRAPAGRRRSRRPRRSGSGICCRSPRPCIWRTSGPCRKWCRADFGKLDVRRQRISGADWAMPGAATVAAAARPAPARKLRRLHE